MKTKLSLIVLCVIFLHLSAAAQDRNQLQLYYGFVADSDLIRKEILDGAASYSVEKPYEFGLSYVRELSDRFALETGIQYTKTTVKITPAYIGIPIESRNEDLKLFSIPFYANYSFGNYFYFNGGPMLAIDSSDGSADSQSGLGYSIGIGAKYNFDNFLIFVNPNFKKHALIPFEKEKYHQRLTVFSIQLGIGYQF